MRIDLNPGATIAGTEGEKASSQVPPARQAERIYSPESDASVGKLETAALNSPEVRTEKVQALRSQLQSGSYQVAAAQIAGSILEQMRVRRS